MINELVLQNFQGFATRQSIRLAPLTLIFGPNSSGKSSIARSLLMLQQSFSGFSSINQGLVFRGPSIDLASFSNVIHRHDLNNLLTIGLSAPAATQLLPSGRFAMPSGRVVGGVRGLELMLKHLTDVYYSLETSANEIVRIAVEFRFEPGNFVDFLARDMNSGSIVIEMERNPDGIFSVSDFTGVEILNDLFHVASRRTPLHSKNDSDFTEVLFQIDALPSLEDWQEGMRYVRLRGLYPSTQPGLSNRNEEILGKISEILEALFRATRTSIARAADGIYHVKPLREIPERLLIVDETDSHQPRQFGNSNRHRPSHDVVSDWVKKLTNGQYELRTEEFSSEEVGFLGTLRAKYLFDTKTKTPVSFKDVGVGLSQVLPIIEALEVAQRVSARNSNAPGKTTLIEQPELHLHPRMQADLMDLMVDVCLEPNSEVQIIAETHSENMVLRLQKRIRDGKISPSKVAILYADRDSDGNNQITELTLNEEGDFNEEWPLSFADVRVQDLF